ncbi:DUF5753 domain-containing protein [Actinomadura rubrisoli]|uniref:DUF5753 domain-containing protein n=1 Tax=Actinomadura rubrisoli TaxID=2530368 RepID=A0A4R5AFV3_9ACTN|nr:DUF5753 domain-containing protein [Actinomadura rubrisoli]TDD71463.1 hypothetical protein E1298_35755 [Actinomadura rubrisoli]
MPDERKRIVDAFSRHLDAAYHRAGIRSYSELAKRSERITAEAGAETGRVTHVSRSAAYTILRGKRERLPSWDQVAQLVRTFHAEASDRNIDPAVVGTMAEWKARYEAAATALRMEAAPSAAPVRVPAPAGAGPAPSSGGPQTWWRDYADVVPAWFERHLNHEPLSDRITCYETSRVPDLLQTRQYAAEAIRLRHGREPADVIARRVELRMLRRRHLDRAVGRPQMWAIINEGALRDRAVSRPVMRAQLRHLLDLGRHIHVQVVPASHPAHDAADGPITILRFRSLRFPDHVFLEHADGALYPCGEEDRGHYLHAVQKLALAALLPQPSRDLLRRIEAEI